MPSGKETLLCLIKMPESDTASFLLPKDYTHSIRNLDILRIRIDE